MADPPPDPHPVVGARAAAAAAAAARALMPPPPSRAPLSTSRTDLPPAAPPVQRQAVLDEDSYLHTMAAIVERDFFPDVPRLQSRLEWLASGDDQAALAAAQRRAAARRAGARLPLGAGAAAAAGRAGRGAWAPTPDVREVGGEEEDGEGAGFGGAQTPPPLPPSLDAFLSAHTSEDNAAFSALAARDAARAREAAARRTGGGGAGGHAGPGSTLFLGAGTGAALALPAPPGGGPAGPPARPPAPRAAATRLGGVDAAAAGGSPGTSLAGSGTPSEWGGTSCSVGGGGGSERGGSVGPSARRATAGDPLLASPLVTWGELTATPVRLDGGRGGFRVAAPAPREALARRAGGGGRGGGSGGLRAAPPSVRPGGPAGTPLRGASATPALGVRGGGVGRLGTALRAAAVARSGGGGGGAGGGGDALGLRSSYATPVRGRSVTPAVGTHPRVTPDVRGGGGGGDGSAGVNTDGLLRADL